MRVINNSYQKVRLSLVMLAFIVLGSCKSTKTLVGGEVDTKMSVRTIINNHYNNQANFKTLRGRLKIDYSNGDESQGVNVSLRMEKDKVIWMSAPLGVVKAHITPQKVSFYNKLQNEYFDGDFSYLSNLLGTQLDFEKVQNMLLGNAVLDLRAQKYTSDISQGNYELKPKKAAEFFKTMFQLEPRNFKIALQQIAQPEDEREFNAKYTYQNISGNVLPKEIQIVASENGSSTRIDLDFRNLELNKTLNFPYQVPDGYDKIILK